MRYLSTSIDKSEYGIPLNQVKEVISFPDISPMPNMPHDYLGIMSLREAIIPVLDLRLKFGAPQTLTHETAVIICGVGKGHVGLVVDCVHGVCAPPEQEVMRLDQMESDVLNSSPGVAVVEKEHRLVLIIDISRVISAVHIDPDELQKSLGQMKIGA